MNRTTTADSACARTSALGGSGGASPGRRERPSPTAALASWGCLDPEVCGLDSDCPERRRLTFTKSWSLIPGWFRLARRSALRLWPESPPATLRRRPPQTSSTGRSAVDVHLASLSGNRECHSCREPSREPSRPSGHGRQNEHPHRRRDWGISWSTINLEGRVLWVGPPGWIGLRRPCRLSDYIIPPMSPMPPGGPPPFFSSGSATIASVIRMLLPIDAAF